MTQFRAQLNKLLTTLLISSACLSAVAQAATPAYLDQHKTTPEDVAAINKVVENFGIAIKTKNPKLLSTLVLNSKILFVSPWPEEDIKIEQAQTDTTFDGVTSGGYERFADFIKNEKSTMEEKFYNVKVTQDDNLAWVMSDFEFIGGGVVLNHGVEVWQLMKVGEGNWKILSVVWSSKGKPGV